MRKLDMYWMSDPEWWEIVNHIPKVKENAPEDVKKSYENYLLQLKELSEED